MVPIQGDPAITGPRAGSSRDHASAKVLAAPGAADPGRAAQLAGSAQKHGGSVVDGSSGLAANHSRPGAGPSAEVPVGREGAGAHDVFQLLETVLPQVPAYRQATVTARDFEPGERVEVDCAGDTLQLLEVSTGEIHKTYVFVAGLGFSQLLFAGAAEDTRSRNWLGCHRRMFEFYGGHLTVPGLPQVRRSRSQPWIRGACRALPHGRGPSPRRAHSR